MSIETEMKEVVDHQVKRQQRSYGWLVWMVLATVLAGGYYYLDVLTNYVEADAQCIKFAEENELRIAWDADPSDKKIFVAKKYIRGNRVVVELGQKTAKKKGYYQSRLCVIGGGQIMIPGAFEQWQYR